MISKAKLENIVLRASLFFLNTGEIKSSVLNLILMRNDEIETPLFDNVQYFLYDGFEKMKNMTISMIALIFSDDWYFMKLT